jgi:hypothetical protein
MFGLLHNPSDSGNIVLTVALVLLSFFAYTPHA